MAKRRALLSVADKTGIEDLARRLTALDFDLISTGGTRRYLAGEGVQTLPVRAVTGFPEMLAGRVKTLHPLLHGAILGRREVASHRKDMAAAGIVPIDLVCVNFPPFPDRASQGRAWQSAVQDIDVGGPALVRSAAKNHEDVLVLTSPDQYEKVLAALEGDRVTLELRRDLAATAFAATEAYDTRIRKYFEGRPREGAAPPAGE